MTLSQTQTFTEVRRKWLLVLLAALAVLLTVSIHRDIASRAGLNDDDLDFYYNALAFDYPERYDAINAQVSTHLLSEHVDPKCNCRYKKFRYDLRAEFRNHYVLYHYLIQGVRYTLMPFTRDAGVDYATSVGTFLIATYYLSFLAAMILVGAAIAGFVRFELVVAFAIAVPVLLLVREYSPYLPGFWELRVRPDGIAGWVRWIHSAVFLFVSPSSTFIGYFPRGLAMFLMLGIFLLRWSNRHAVAYAALAIVTAVHQGTGALILFTLLAIDAALWPQRFRSLATLIGIAIAFVPLTIPHGILGNLTGISWWGIPVLAVVIVAILILDNVLAKSRNKSLVVLNGLREWIRAFGSIPADLVAIAVLWFAWSAVSVIMYFKVGQPDAIYTWGDLPSRYLMAFRGPVYLGIVAVVMIWLARRLSLEILAGIGVVLCLAVTWLFVTPGHYLADLSRIAKSPQAYERMLQQQKPDKSRTYDEGLTYYATSKTLEIGTDFVTPLLKTFAPN